VGNGRGSDNNVEQRVRTVRETQSTLLSWEGGSFPLQSMQEISHHDLGAELSARRGGLVKCPRIAFLGGSWRMTLVAFQNPVLRDLM
jgi:hypothetical protein